MYGAIVGDLAGSIYEYDQLKDIHSIQMNNLIEDNSFYSDDTSANDAWHKMGVMCVEMESAALYLNAQRLGKKALCILTISDHIYKKEELDAKQRQIGFTNMMEIALNTAINFAD